MGIGRAGTRMAWAGNSMAGAGNSMARTGNSVRVRIQFRQQSVVQTGINRRMLSGRSAPDFLKAVENRLHRGVGLTTVGVLHGFHVSDPHPIQPPERSANPPLERYSTRPRRRHASRSGHPLKKRR